MKTNALWFAAAATLFALPALAQQYDPQLYQQQQYDPQLYQQQQYDQRQVAVGQPPPGQAQPGYDREPEYDQDRDRDCEQEHEHEGRIALRGGHYELRTLQKWVEGHYENVFVPGPCFGRHVQICRPGVNQQQWVPGRYVAVQEYVWVDRHPGHGWGRFHSHFR